jgi:P-type E1-E2 ATPase
VIELKIPGIGKLNLKHLVSDVNGTLAIDGKLIDGVAQELSNLQDRLEIHLLTADTHRKQSVLDQQLGIQAVRIPAGKEAEAKADYIRDLGSETVFAVGQGANDAQMLREAVIGVCIISQEGTNTRAIQSADLVVPDIHSAFDLLKHPLRLVASLRS